MNKIWRNKIKQIETIDRMIMLIQTKVTNGGMNNISLKFGVKVAVLWGRVIPFESWDNKIPKQKYPII
jgi:hypothetical protein